MLKHEPDSALPESLINLLWHNTILSIRKEAASNLGRFNRTDTKGKISIRRAGKLHHAHAGATNANRRVLAIIDNTTVTVTDLYTGEVLSTHLIDPDRNYWRNQQKGPGRWPGPFKNVT